MPRKNDGAGDPPVMYPVLTDQPGVSVSQPVRRARLVAWTVAAMIGAATVAGCYVATTIAGSETKRVARETIAEMDRRKVERDAAQAQRDVNQAILYRVIEQYRRDMCTVIAGEPQTPKLADIARRYRCDVPYEQVVPPTWTPAPRGSGPPLVVPTPTGPPSNATIAPPGEQPDEPEPAQSLTTT